LTLDVIKLADPVQRLAGDLGFGGGVDVEEVAAQMGPTRGLVDAGLGSVRCLKRLEAGTGIRLQDAAEPGQVALRMFALGGRPRTSRPPPAAVEAGMFAPIRRIARSGDKGEGGPLPGSACLHARAGVNFDTKTYARRPGPTILRGMGPDRAGNRVIFS